MPILNFTTKIDPWKTVGEIQQILSKNNVSHVSIKNEGSSPVALSFTIDYHGRPLNFLLPCNHEGVLNCLKRDRKVPNSSKNSEQALRTSWRIVKDWVEAQMAIVQAELTTLPEVFMPYLVVNAQGETLSSKMLNGDGMKLLSN
ncbi:MAG TPA: hypothetical protein VD996_02570 [Chitinophagaceae bacterium]|nr:hypothetical protein [Chitinophagaceae bacterium]